MGILKCRQDLDLDMLVAPLAGDRTPQLPEGLDLAAVSQADLGILGEAEGPLPWSGTSPAGYDPVEDRLGRDALAAMLGRSPLRGQPPVARSWPMIRISVSEAFPHVILPISPPRGST